MSGPPPTPTPILKLHGSALPGRRKGEPKVRQSKPACPQFLTAQGKAEWKRVTIELEALGMLHKYDRSMLAAWCEAWSEFYEAVKLIAKEGRTFKTDKGNLIQHPMVGIKNKAAERLIKISDRFGMSPSARTRINVDGAKIKEDDELQELLKRGDGNRQSG